MLAAMQRWEVGAYSYHRERTATRRATPAHPSCLHQRDGVGAAQRITRISPTLGMMGGPASLTIRLPAGQYTKKALPII